MNKKNKLCNKGVCCGTVSVLFNLAYKTKVQNIKYDFSKHLEC